MCSVRCDHTSDTLDNVHTSSDLILGGVPGPAAVTISREIRSRGGNSPGTPSDSAVLHGRDGRGGVRELRHDGVQSGVGVRRACVEQRQSCGGGAITHDV